MIKSRKDINSSDEQFLEYFYRSYDRYYDVDKFGSNFIPLEEMIDMIKNSEKVYVNYTKKLLLIKFSHGYYKIGISRQLSDLRIEKINKILE